MCEQEKYNIVADVAPERAQPKEDPWAHRSIGMRCKTCMWWLRKDDQRLKLLNDHETLGRCRRHAPTMGGFPVVYAVDWCGDHKLDGGKLR